MTYLYYAYPRLGISSMKNGFLLFTYIRGQKNEEKRVKKNMKQKSFWIFSISFTEIEDLPPGTQEQLYSELLDRDAQRELEEESHIINWSQEVRVRLGSRLHALWNRSAGDCLLDSVLQATWGVFDRDNTLRRAMADSLHEAGHV